jgi:malonyl-CoA/methylmalonyl-CoA synthetase
VNAWQWSASDHILNVLPLHHVHGIINVVCCALWAGATVQFIEKFDPQLVWQQLTDGTINIFMAVPTIYYKLIEHWHQQSDDMREYWSKAVSGFRLMVSGSAALPTAVLEQWKKISGHILLERYGMTEIGMALSNPYHGERRPGHVGTPLPGVEIRLVDHEKNIETAGVAGEIQVKGPMVFAEYWNNPTATQAAFTVDGWFKTGDIARINNGYYQIMGRDSVDIIKSGGYKISALEIEEALREHPLIRDCAVVGIPDFEWGEVIGAALVTNGEKINQVELKQWLKEYIPSYKIPRRYTLVDDLPRNAMGKVTKKEVVKLF